MAASTLLVGNLSAYPTGSGSSAVETSGGNSNFPAGTAAGAATFGALSIGTPNYFPSSTVWVVGYMDGTGHMHLFQANNGSTPTIAYPTLTQITQIWQQDSAGNNKSGGFRVYLTPGVNSPDQSSPETVFLDQDAVLIYTTNSAFG
jgi:hypothetical protein